MGAVSTQEELESLIRLLRAGGVSQFAGFGIELKLDPAPQPEVTPHVGERDTAPASLRTPPRARAVDATGKPSDMSRSEWASIMYGSAEPTEEPGGAAEPADAADAEAGE